MPESMRAARYTGAGGTEVIRFDAVAMPDVGPRQVLVRVRAAGLNRADIVQRRGQYPAPPGWPADIPGLEYAGEVAALGAGVTQWRAGDRVMGLVGGGAMAEYVAVHEDEALPVPDALGLEEAAAVPEAFLTAWDALTVRGRVQPGERVLIHAVASGVGTAAIQLVRLLGATSVGTSRTPAKLARCRALGLDEAIDTSAAPFGGQLRAPVHVILDVFGAGSFDENLAALAPRGRLVMLGFLQGAKGALDLGPVLRKRLEIVGSTMRVRPPEERVPLVAEARRALVPLLGTSLRPVVEAVLPMAQLAEAQSRMERDETFGKVVLAW